MSRVFEHDQLVRFSHCDPAGIVYFPEFFDMAQSALEDWFTHGLGQSHAALVMTRRIGTPTVSIQCDFRKPFRMGETLHFELRVLKTGRSSMQLSYSGRKDGDEHLAITQTVCFIDLDSGKPIPIPEDLREPIESYRVLPGDVK